MSHIIRPKTLYIIQYNKSTSIKERAKSGSSCLPLPLERIDTSWPLTSLCYALALKELEKDLLSNVEKKNLIHAQTISMIYILDNSVSKLSLDDTLHIHNVRHLKNFKDCLEFASGNKFVFTRDITKLTYSE